MAVLKFAEARTAEEYADLQHRLQPRGRGWVHSLLDGLGRTYLGLGAEWARLHGRVLDLLDEADPSTASELLSDWEAALGLPGECGSLPATEAERQALAHAKLISLGGQSPGSYIEAFTAAGYTDPTLQIQVPAFFRIDESAIEERLYDRTFAWVWYVYQDSTPTQGWDALECLLRQIKAAHCVVVAIDTDGANTDASEVF